MTLGDLLWITLIFGPVTLLGLTLIALGLNRRRRRQFEYLPTTYAALTGVNPSLTATRLACEESARNSQARRAETNQRLDNHPGVVGWAVPGGGPLGGDGSEGWG